MHIDKEEFRLDKFISELNIIIQGMTVERKASLFKRKAQH